MSNAIVVSKGPGKTTFGENLDTKYRKGIHVNLLCKLTLP